jgi:hypothetical protein
MTLSFIKLPRIFLRSAQREGHQLHHQKRRYDIDGRVTELKNARECTAQGKNDARLCPATTFRICEPMSSLMPAESRRRADGGFRVAAVASSPV